MKKKTTQERHQIVRLYRNTQRKLENQIRLKKKQQFDLAKRRFSANENNIEENA